jgi:hypothetical protein
MGRVQARIPPWVTYFFPSFGALLWMGTFVVVLGLGRGMINADGDLGRHITIGNYILDHARVPLRDLFTHTTAGQPFTPHEWLAEVIFAVTHRLMGLNGPVLISAVVIATAFWLVWVRTRDGRRNLLPAVIVTILATAGSAIHWLSRPHIFTFLFLAVWMIVLHQMSTGKSGRWWLLPVIMLLWANTHGGAVGGIATWALYGAGLGWNAFLRRKSREARMAPGFWRRYLAAGAGASLATLANPAGLGLWLNDLGHITNQYMASHTIEFLPPSIHNSSTWPFWFLGGMFVVMMVFASIRRRAELVFPGAAWLAMAVYSARNIPLFLIVSAPLLAQGLEETWSRLADRFGAARRFLVHDSRLLDLDQVVKGPVLPLLLVIGTFGAFQAGFHLDFQGKGNAYDSGIYPVEAVSWIQSNPQQGEMFNAFTWGGYLLYREWPKYRVFIDAGAEGARGEALTRQYLTVINRDSGWENVLDQYHVEWVILPPSEPVATTLRSTTGWQAVYEDGTAVIFRRGN